MTIRDVFHLLLVTPWIIFLIYWIIGAFKTRPTRQEESPAFRYLVVLLEVTAYCWCSTIPQKSDFWESDSFRTA